ncbi:MAG: aminoglycoside phosphotransferase family protein [Actinomycetota bacterium]|nr:aminoglycoside phosphotransferase family protein [Actinomycetota bacterium]
MLEPPDLADEVIVSTLHEKYGIRVGGLAFLPVGNDSESWAYRIDATDGTTYFLKVRSVMDQMAGLVVPRHLQDRGVPHIVGPLRTGGESLSANADGFALIVYPFIMGSMGADVGLSANEWRTLGFALRQVHDIRLTPNLERELRVESFTLNRRALIPDLEAALATRTSSDPAAAELARFWQARREEIRLLVHRADALARRLEGESLPLSLCHADLHTWNVLIDGHQLWIVDWDETILAPKERDLMFVVGGIAPGLVRPKDTAAFLQGYGEASINPVALVYYRYAWAVQDIAAFGEQVLLLPSMGQKSRLAAVQDFKKLFQPGHIVQLARASDGIIA